jgi:hypothetical protein
MFRTRWTRKLLAPPRYGGQCRRQPAQTRGPIRRMLESREERLTLSGGNVRMTQTAGSDAAELASVGDPSALQELELFSDVFLRQPLP